MNWFFIALGAPFLWAIVNIADTYLVSRYSEKEKERSSGGLVLFSSLIGLVVAFFILIFTSGIWSVSMIDKLLLFITGGLTIVWIIFYLYALEIEDISSIVPWFLVVPIFGYFLGYIFLGETLTKYQIIGTIIVLLGAILNSIDFSGEKRKIKKRPVFYMICACVAIAVSGVIFKFVTIEGNFWVSSFWEYFGLGIFGLIIYIFIPKYRREFHHMRKIGGIRILFLNIISEFMSIIGNLMTNFALLLAPVTMVFLVSSFQPAIVLILTILGTKFLPHIIKENISLRVLIPKILAIAIMIIGSLFLFI
jgi:drug/metabolite transporter (DMT)-like permease